ncbi:MAG: amidohydrolase [Ruminococcaceae bacterium]|nr:amidohydrolase [Oscillospiraceae bacterium]
MILLTNARIYAGTQLELMEHGYILIDGSVIKAVGDMADAPKNISDTRDLGGATVTPGFIDAHCHLGMWEDSLGFEGDDGNESTDPITPHLRAIDAVNPLDRYFAEALSAGVTTVVTGPGSANPIGGTFVAMKTHGSCVDDMIVKSPCAMKMALGENPKYVHGKKGKAPLTRMATAALIRRTLTEARTYAQKKGGDNPPDTDLRMEALLPVLDGSLPVKFHAHRADDICTALRIAEEFSLNASLEHVTDGALMPERLKEAGVPLCVGPYLTDRSKPELKNLTPATAAGLLAAGLPVSVITDHPVTPCEYLPLCAHLLRRYGVSQALALRSVTVNPALACGIADRVGAIAPGLDADLVIFDGDPLDPLVSPKQIFVNGESIA